MENQILFCRTGYARNVLLSCVMVLPRFHHLAQGGRDALQLEGIGDIGLGRPLHLRVRQTPRMTK